ncbi:MAG: ThiF family adenylyltransferase [Nitrososphaerota archaeon]
MSSGTGLRGLPVLQVYRMDDDVYERQRRIWNQDRIGAMRVLVGGAGALGNEIVKNLVQIGVKRVYVVDFDHVVASNLNRCLFFRRSDALRRSKKVEVLARRASQINSDVEVVPIHGDIRDLGDDVIRDVDVALGAFDNFHARLVLNLRCYERQVPLIDGGIEGLLGTVQVVVPPFTPCIECGITDMDLQHLWERFSCGGEATGLEGPKIPYVPMTGAVVAGIQVAECVKVHLGLERFKREGNWSDSVGEPMAGKSLLIDLRTGSFYAYDLQRRSDCNVCSL